MAPSPQPPKRKRGRPQNASKPTTTASTNPPDDYEADVEESRPRKRGRPKRASGTAQPVNAPVQNENHQQPKRKRGRPSLEDARANAQNESEQTAPPRRKRGRPSLEEQQRREAQAAEGSGHRETHDSPQRGAQQQHEDGPEETRLPRKRGRKPAQDQSEQQQKRRQKKQPEDQSELRPEPDAEPEAEPAARSKRGRTRPSGDKSQPVEKAEQQERPQRTGARSSLQDIPHEQAHNKGGKGGRPKRAKRTSDANADDAENRDESQSKKGRRQPMARTSTGSDSRRRSGDAPDEEQDPKQQEDPATSKTKSRRRSGQKDGDDDIAPPSPPKPYMHIAPQTRHIRPSTIAAKWPPLSGASLPATHTILSLAQQPIIQRTAATRNRRQHAEAALNLVARRVARKLNRGLPFPPASINPRDGRPGRPAADADGGRAVELDFESVLDGRSVLERQLTPALHAVELLRRERTRIEKELERDYENLRDLETRARAQTRERNEQLKKAHVLAPTSRPKPQESHDRSIITTGGSGSVFKDLDDPDLQSLALQLSGHVDSIHTNLQQGDGITEQLGRSRAALQGVLMRYLEQDAYERVVIG
ncbi:CENP-Q, a CENPA-CAD centromere complex subunit-domain-containing protein [Thelonectria olida]|uniref:CENP-Q, a CENPA-CAD centromere complex subunit-domain-containing protein n=1 Tax=Thelonectria olida TaxID=1576542 RepID=A0A9P8WH49_9HYPO|nr:CENP-Q, a CENPA-CAD centromere complex subunit-domain-containing protein [Thelonectria olida]